MKKLSAKKVMQVVDWYNSKRDSIQQIVESSKDKNVKFMVKGSEVADEPMEIPEQHRTGFVLGLIAADSIFGEFPLSVRKV